MKRTYRTNERMHKELIGIYCDQIKKIRKEYQESTTDVDRFAQLMTKHASKRTWLLNRYEHYCDVYTYSDECKHEVQLVLDNMHVQFDLSCAN